MSERTSIIVIAVATFAVCLVLTAANLYYGELNQDEGWYLYAARMVSEGQMPYRDFAFTQGPVMALVYSAADPLVDIAGVAGGRLFTALLGLAAAFLAAWLAARMSRADRRWHAAVVAFALVGVNVYHSYFCTVVKTYALCSMFLVLAFVALSFMRSKFGGASALASGLLFSLGAGTRVSSVMLLPVVFLCLWFYRRKGGGGDGERQAVPARIPFWFLVGGVGGCLLVFLPFLLMSPDNFLFGLVEYHTQRKAGSLGTLLVYKAGFISRVVQAYFVAIVLAVAVVLRKLIVKGRADVAGAERDVISPMLCIGVGLVTLVHFLTAVPYDDYQVAIFPLLAVVLSVAVVRLPRDGKGLQWIVLTVVLVSVGAAFSSPINQSWFLKERDRIWWRVKDQPPLAKLQEAGAALSQLAGSNRMLLTQDTYLAVESGLSVPKGMELGPFCYYPDWDDEKARSRHVLNETMLKDILSNSEAAVAAFSGYGLAIESPGVTELSAEKQAELLSALSEGYREAAEIGHFGQALTTLRVFTRK